VKLKEEQSMNLKLRKKQSNSYLKEMRCCILINLRFSKRHKGNEEIIKFPFIMLSTENSTDNTVS